MHLTVENNCNGLLLQMLNCLQVTFHNLFLINFLVSLKIMMLFMEFKIRLNCFVKQYIKNVV